MNAAVAKAIRAWPRRWEFVFGTPEDTSLRARLKDAKVVDIQSFSDVRYLLHDRRAVATGGVIDKPIRRDFCD